MASRSRLSKSMTEAQFVNGYWYVGDLRDFARELGIPSASKLRKDELESAIRHFLCTGEAKSPVRRAPTKRGPRDVDRGLSLDLEVSHYTSNKQTKDFILTEALKIDPAFKQKPGTRYLLNRWREEQISSGKRITYGDLVEQAIELNRTKTGPLRVEHGRYINFISDFMAANQEATSDQAIAAWHALKEMDAPKTYESWAQAFPDTQSP